MKHVKLIKEIFDLEKNNNEEFLNYLYEIINSAIKYDEDYIIIDNPSCNVIEQLQKEGFEVEYIGTDTVKDDVVERYKVSGWSNYSDKIEFKPIENFKSIWDNNKRLNKKDIEYLKKQQEIINEITNSILDGKEKTKVILVNNEYIKELKSKGFKVKKISGYDGASFIEISGWAE